MSDYLDKWNEFIAEEDADRDTYGTEVEDRNKESRKQGAKKMGLEERCQKGYKTHPTRKTKKMYGKTYRNCIKAEGEEKELEEVAKKTNMSKSLEELALQILDEKSSKSAKRKRRKKRAKKKAKKDDRCTRIAKRKYDVWPSAYASGAVVQCRRGKIWKGLKEEEEPGLEIKIRKALRDEGGAAGMDALVKHTEASEKEIKDAIRDMDDVGRHEDGDYILDDGESIDVLEEKWSKEYKRSIDCDNPKGFSQKAHCAGRKKQNEAALDEKKKKAGTESSKESSLRDWFGRKGAPGKKGGWVDCNTCRKDKKTGRKKCKPCGRQKGEKRAKYPSCRPTPGACGERGRGKSWGKKSAKNEGLIKIALQELQNNLFKPGLRHHVDNGIPVTENIYRIGSPCYFNVIQQARHFYNKGIYEVLNDEERDLLENTDLGEWGMYEGERVPLDFPMYEETLEEAEYKGKKVQLGKPTTGDVKKYKVYVRNKAGNVIKVNYGDRKGGLKGNWNNAEARASFAARHNCADKKDRTKAGYWACRAHKDFGKNVPGRFW